MTVSEKRLSELNIGDKGKVKSISGERTLRRRVREMGLIVCADVEVDKIAPFGDPMGIVVQDYHLSLRRQEADNIMVELVDLEAGDEINRF
ncbi:MAG: ferrous iron transport protein A [bacterium]|nr:ferrous iron transport protein A [bacterium]